MTSDRIDDNNTGVLSAHGRCSKGAAEGLNADVLKWMIGSQGYFYVLYVMVKILAQVQKQLHGGVLYQGDVPTQGGFLNQGGIHYQGGDPTQGVVPSQGGVLKQGGVINQGGVSLKVVSLLKLVFHLKVVFLLMVKVKSYF